MADLGPYTPAATYGYLLQVSAGITGSLGVVQDGVGNPSALSLSSTDVSVAGDLTVAGQVNVQAGGHTTTLARPGTGSDYSVTFPSAVAGGVGQAMVVTAISGGTVTLDWQDVGSTSSSSVGLYRYVAGSSPATYGLTATDLAYQFIFPFGSSGAVTVNLPNLSTLTNGRYFLIKNVSTLGSPTVTVKDFTGVTTLATLSATQKVELLYDTAASPPAWVVV